ncbi:glutamate--tRNA ligase [Candidatus Beckwithbacteria bacterium]|nr:glutamate--tRNA ligase [Candidatus Beckwithbacteria bacterium]
MVRTRVAPSPTGYPHVGSLYQAWLDYAFAKKHDGKFLIRIEDTDRTRFVADAEEKIYEGLDWAGLTEDESPRKPGDVGPYRQSQRLDIYKKHAQELVAKGHAYYCFCTPERLNQVRTEMQKVGKVPMYDRHCRNLSPEEVQQRIQAGEKYVIRLKVPDNQTIKVQDLIRGEITFHSNDVDDQVLLKSDGFATYHLASMVDDHLMGITHVVRGEEWLPSSPKHILIYDFFGWEKPVFFHTPTLRNPDKSKLSKRKGHTNILWYKEQGFLPEALINYLSLMGWSHPEEKDIFSKEEFIKLFDLKDFSPAGPIFDEVKLRWMNGKYIREVISEDELFNKLKQYLTLPISDEILKKTIPLIKERLEVLSDINELLKFLLPEQEIDVELVKKQSNQSKNDQSLTGKSPEEIKQLLTDLKTVLENLDTWETGEIEKVIRNLKGKYKDWGGRDYFMTIRVATTAFPVTPPLFESIEVLGKDLVLQRIESVLQRL